MRTGIEHKKAEQFCNVFGEYLNHSYTDLNATDQSRLKGPWYDFVYPEELKYIKRKAGPQYEDAVMYFWEMTDEQQQQYLSHFKTDLQLGIMLFFPEDKKTRQFEKKNVLFYEEEAQQFFRKPYEGWEEHLPGFEYKEVYKYHPDRAFFSSLRECAEFIVRSENYWYKGTWYGYAKGSKKKEMEYTCDKKRVDTVAANLKKQMNSVGAGGKFRTVNEFVPVGVFLGIRSLKKEFRSKYLNLRSDGRMRYMYYGPEVQAK